MREQVSAVIPAYNEGPRIEAVIQAAQESMAIDNIVVVDDGSTDNTAKIALEKDGLIVLEHERKLGKGQAMDTGVEQARKLGSGIVSFLDADLTGLTADHVTDLVTPVQTGEAIMTYGIPERLILQKWLSPQQGKLSGQRALHIQVWEELPNWCRHGYRPEMALIMLAKKQGWQNQVMPIPLEGVQGKFKWEKEGNTLRAILGYLDTCSAALATYIGMSLRRASANSLD